MTKSVLKNSSYMKQHLGEIVKMFSRQGALAFFEAIRTKQDVVMRQHIEIVNTIAPHLDKKMRDELLNNIRENHASKTLLGNWENHPAYQELKINNPTLYADFKGMKQGLKP